MEWSSRIKQTNEENSIPFVEVELRHYRDIYIRTSEVTNGCSSATFQTKKCFGRGKVESLLFVTIALIYGFSVVIIQLIVGNEI